MQRSHVEEIFKTPLIQLVSQAHSVHEKNFDPLQVQTSTLLSIKTGGCPEDCSYCPQSAHYKTGVKREALLALDETLEAAGRAKASGATRFCMGAAWREVKDGPEFDRVLEMVSEVRGLGLEVCCTLGMLNENQAQRLKDAGLYAYNHNIDSSKEFYEKIISTRKYQERLDTIQHVRNAGLTVCTGGILGMGESEEDRISFLHQLATFDPQPESVTINALVPIPGTPLGEAKPIEALDLARVIAAARILMPHSMIRLSAGRTNLSKEGQFLCFFAGANSVFLGEKLLTSPNPDTESDMTMFKELGLKPMESKINDYAHFSP